MVESDGLQREICFFLKEREKKFDSLIFLTDFLRKNVNFDS